jgi:hypothetical protein
MSARARRYRLELTTARSRQLVNRWVGILRWCLEAQTPYCEDIAWRTGEADAARPFAPMGAYRGSTPRQ